MERHARRLTTANALLGGEIDFVEQFPYDLLPMVEGNKDLKEESLSPVGYFTMYRFNFKYPPFNNKKIRQAAMYAVGQEDVMKALVGNPKYWRTCASLWAAARRWKPTSARMWWCRRTPRRPRRC